VTGYPGTDREERVAAPALRDLVGTMFGRCGMSGEDATLLADTLIVADLQGVHSHGVLRVPEYVRKLRAEGVDPRGRPRVVTDRGAALVVDGGNSMGQIGAAFAMRRAIERAGDTNVAVAAVRGSNHCGAMAYYAAMALPKDMVGLAATNALPTMAPWGGVDKILGKEMKLKTATGAVLSWGPVSTKAKRKLFQEVVKAKIAVATMPGRTSGSAIRAKAPRREQPSSHAASSSSRGTSSK
jgi:hypothetical protein